MDESQSKGSLIGSIVVVVILIVGAVYLFANRVPRSEAPAETPETAPSDAGTDALLQVSNSDEVSDLEADIAATDLSNLDQESAVIEAELQ